MGLSLFALGITLIFIGALSFREIFHQESKFKKTLGWIFGFIFTILGVVAIVNDVRAEEPEYQMCVYYTVTGETACMDQPTDLYGCTETKTWFETESAWHGMNRYCCIAVGDIVNQCLTNRSDQQKRIDSLMDHYDVWTPPSI